MKIAIIYSTKNGVSLECAKKLQNELSRFHEVTLFNILENPPCPDGYDICVLGGSVRMGRLAKDLTAYISVHATAISAKHSAFYFCFGLSDRFEEYSETLLPEGVTFNLGIHQFGGELKPDKLKGFDKFIVKTVRKSIVNHDFEEGSANQPSLPEILPENITLLAEKIKKLSTAN